MISQYQRIRHWVIIRQVSHGRLFRLKVAFDLKECLPRPPPLSLPKQKQNMRNPFTRRMPSGWKIEITLWRNQLDDVPWAYYCLYCSYFSYLIIIATPSFQHKNCGTWKMRNIARNCTLRCWITSPQSTQALLKLTGCVNRHAAWYRFVDILEFFRTATLQMQTYPLWH